MRLYSLAFLTVFDVGPVEAIRIAAEAGYDLVGLRLLPASPIEAAYPLLNDAKLLNEVMALLQDTGMAVADVELVRLKPETDLGTFIPFLERAQALNAHHAIVVGDDPDLSRLTDNFARLCEMAAPCGLTVDLEFMPWTKVPDLARSRHVVTSAACENGGILIDALHLHRSGFPLEEVRHLEASRMHLFQICDAPAKFDLSASALIHTARANRLMPGDGEIDLRTLAGLIPDATVISVEVPNVVLSRTISPLERARSALRKAKAYFPEF